MTVTDELKSADTKQAYDDFAADFSKLREDLAVLKADLANLTQQGASDAKSAVKEGFSAAEDHTRDAVETAADELQEIQKQAERAVRKKPLSALAGALAIGYFLASLRR